MRGRERGEWEEAQARRTGTGEWVSVPAGDLHTRLQVVILILFLSCLSLSSLSISFSSISLSLPFLLLLLSLTLSLFPHSKSGQIWYLTPCRWQSSGVSCCSKG